MNNTMAGMFIMLFVISAVFNIALGAFHQPSVQGPGQIQNVSFDKPNPAYGFLGPLVVVWNFIKDMVKFVNAPFYFMASLGAPSSVVMLFAVPWSIAWVYSLVSFVRGFRA